MNSVRQRVGAVATCVLALALAVSASNASAQAGGKELILDSQSGIHGGAPGTVLQTGPITGSGMVQARPMAQLLELPQQNATPIMVAPYIEIGPPGQSVNGTSSGNGSNGRSYRARVQPAAN